MRMKIIRGTPASGKPLRITCSGCGKRAPEAGIAVSPDAAEEGHSSIGPVTIIDEDETYPLCEACCSALEAAS